MKYIYKDEQGDIVAIYSRPQKGLDLIAVEDNDPILTQDSPREIKGHISEYRKTMENGGVEVSGMLIQTDSESRSNLLGASQLGVAINWKAENGFVELTNEQIQGIALVVGTHVQKCFNSERVVYEAHDTKPFTSKEAVERAFNNAYKNN